MSDHPDPLQTPVQFVPGCGPNRAELLAKLGIETVLDLLWHLPRDVLDLSHVRAVGELQEDEVQTVRGNVVDVDGRQLSGRRFLTAVLLDCDGEYLRGVWFNQPWVAQTFRGADSVLFSGKPKRRGGRWEMTHPRVQRIEADDLDARGDVLPRYPLTEGLKMDQMRRITRAAVEAYADLIPEHLPDSFRERHELAQLQEAIRQLHVPQSREQFDEARHRVVFDDLLEFQCGLALRRRAWRESEAAPTMEATAKVDARIRRLFPFAFTNGQDAAVGEICADLASGRTMHRLLQADVGAGKTAVAIYAMLVAVAAGYQAVLMAPTEVLTAQHWATIDGILAHSRVERLLLTGNLTAAQRRQALEDIRAGSVQLIVGTQALIQKDVEFAKLGLAVIDEQHRFGVAQRGRFSTSEGETSPHVLVMTATPIPRTLCLTRFGDLDLTAMSDMPPGRQPVVTSRISGRTGEERVWPFVKEQLRAGRQMFVVCPRIESENGSDDAADAASAESVYRELAAGQLRDFRVELIHGQMDREQRARVMDAFRSGEAHALVSTTVVEVGVDVPNATLMIVYQAERFGLSQLHQLRGRISRGKFQGYCFLFSDSDADDAERRLHTLETEADGFKIAEADFELRGPGNVLGTQQHGGVPLKVADLARDQKLLLEARETAFELVDSGELDQPEFVPLKLRVLERFGETMHLPKGG